MTLTTTELMEKKTKSITVTQYDYILRNVNDEEVDIHGHPNHYIEYDEAGHTLKETKYSRQGEFEEMIVYAYDELGNLCHESYYPMEDEIAEEKTYIRNEAGQVVSAQKKYQDGSVDTISYEYNTAGELIKLTTTTDEGEVEQVETFVWENGALAEHHTVDESGEVVDEPDAGSIKPGESRITRNEQGQVITEEELDENGDVFMTVNRSYDEYGLAREVEVFIDGQGRAISRHYFLKYEYTFYE
jgi:hypothetical protein